MSLSRTASLLALLLSVSTFACAVEPGDEEEAGESEDDLRTLASAEVVGGLRQDMEAARAEAPTSGYRAFSFDLAAGEDVVLYLAASGSLDPMAYLLDVNKKQVKRNDDRNASTKDAQIKFKATTGGTYYLAFRTKERTAGTVMARLVSAGAAENGTYADGWPARTKPYQGLITTFDVTVRGKGASTYYGSGCPVDTFEGASDLRTEQQLSVRFQLAEKTVSIASRNASGSGRVGADGRFEIAGSDPRWGHVTARGRIAAGGMVLLDDATTVACDRNSSDQRVFNGVHVVNGIGAVDTN